MAGVHGLKQIERFGATLPEICSLDCGSFNYAEGNYVYISISCLVPDLDFLRAADDDNITHAVRIQLAILSQGLRQLDSALFIKGAMCCWSDGCKIEVFTKLVVRKLCEFFEEALPFGERVSDDTAAVLSDNQNIFLAVLFQLLTELGWNTGPPLCID